MIRSREWPWRGRACPSLRVRIIPRRSESSETRFMVSSTPSMHDVKQLEIVMRYHEETKHHFNRYARALGYMDWANQPNPFRRYEGATLGRLPILSPDEEPLSPPYADLYRSGAVSSAPVTIRTLSRLFEYALALFAWKQAGGTSWALPSNPSTGNLHPTEGYLLIGAVPGVAFTPGLYHYAPREHGLERRADCPEELLDGLMHEFPPQAFLVGLSSIHWREAWKYGERAFRYCQHDAGHAIATVRIAAATLGWSAVVLHCLADETVEDLLGLNRTDYFAGAEREHPDLVMVVWPTDLARDWRKGDDRVFPLFLDPVLVGQMTKQRCSGGPCRGTPSRGIPPFTWPCSSIGWTALTPACTCWPATQERWTSSSTPCTSDSPGPPRPGVLLTCPCTCWSTATRSGWPPR